MASESSASAAISYPGFKDEMLSTNGTPMTGNAIRHFLSPVELSNTLDDGKTHADKIRLSAASNADDPNQRLVADESSVARPAGQKQPLGSVPVGFILPMDHRPSNGQFFVEALLSTQLEDSLRTQLSNLAHDHHADLATAILVAWIVVLSRLSGHESVVLDVCGTFGTKTSTAPRALHFDLSGELDASKLFERVKFNLGVTSTRQSPVDDSVGLVKDGEEPALSQASFYSHSGGLAQPSDHHAIMQCLELHLFHNKKDISMGIRYAADLFNKDTIERYTGYIKTVLMNMVTNKGQPVDLFDIISPDEKKLLLQTWNQTDAEYPADRCVHHLFQDQVDNSPHSMAVVHGEKGFSYFELNSMANHLARRLAHAGVKPGDLVALLFERSIELIVTELAVLKAGAAYVPIETRAPAERFAYIVSHTGARLLVTGEHTSVSDRITTSVLRFDVDKEDICFEQNMPRTSYHSSSSSLDTAYVMFTSGSTGLPKGVMVPHRAIARAVMNNGFADIGPDDRVAFASIPSFDPSTFDIWASLLNGARVIIIDDDVKLDAQQLATFIIQHQVTCLYLTNPLVTQYAPVIGKTLSQLKYLISGAEQGLIKPYSLILQHDGPVHHVNRYGSTETPVSATVYKATGAIDQLDSLPIGRPSNNSRVYVLDKHRNLIPIGAVGELYIGGPGIATGYLDRPDLTAERFLPDPFSDAQGARMYKSGDLARYLPDGNLVCVGRNDDQVKIRGYRIELGEIQVRLVEHPLVRNATAILTLKGEEKQLVAYVEADHHEHLSETLREHLARTLPHYMIPAMFVRMDTLPLTSRGKIDRCALPNPDLNLTVTRAYVAPQGEIETALAIMWSKLLKVKSVGRHDDFFMLGGHSIMAMRLLNSVAADYGPQLPISKFFAAPTVQGLADAISTCINQGDSVHLSIPRVSRDDPLDPSYAQQRLWFLSRIGDATDRYHVNRTLHLHGTLDRVALQRALDNLYARHESLRSVFPTVDGHPKVLILPASYGLPFVIVGIQPGCDQKSTIKQAALQEGVTPFDMERGPLVRAKLIQITKHEHVFLLTMHYIITDGWSMGVMFRDLNKLYDAYSSGLPNPLAPLPIQYPDYAAWQRQQLTQDELDHQAAYWRKTLAGAPVSLGLPIDRPRPPQQSFAGASVQVRFESHLVCALRALSQKHGVTIFMTVLAAWSAVLSRLSGEDDIVIGVPSSNRSHQQLEQLIGFFVNTLALRIDLSEEPSAEQLLKRVRKATMAAQAHQDLPFEQVVEIVQPPRRTDMTPIFQVMFAWQNNDIDKLDLEHVKASVEDTQFNDLKFELDLELIEQDGEIVGDLNYSTALFDRQTIERHVGYLESMLRWMTNNTKEPVATAPILGTAERELLLERWNNTEQPYPDNTCLHQLFEGQVELSPNAVAIVHDERTLTYRELDTQANRIAHQLIDAGVKPGDYVMLLLDRSISLVASQIAVLKTGAAYVPIDTLAPVDRQEYIASDCKSTVLLTEELTDVPSEIQAAVLRISTEHTHIEHLNVKFERSSTSSRDTAYVMYTSGSTGRPKGVMVPHRGIVRLAINNGFATVDSSDRVAFVANPTFDVSTFDVWVPLLNGASIVIIDRETLLDPSRLAVALDHHQVTSLCLTTALLHQYVHVIGPALSRLKYLIGAGEQGLVEAYTEMAKHGGRVCVINMYGPTEASVVSTAYPITTATSQLHRLPIGRPISNTPQYVLDEHLVPVPIGVVGELCIGGPGVANGYLNQPVLTAERFLPDPFAKVQSARMYKTGDLVRYMSDGNLVFVGRNDNQIKIRGFRVELGEIEARLAEHPLVREAAVLALEIDNDGKRLVAYVLAGPHKDLANILHEYLPTTLPEYMIPSAFVRMDAFPLTNNGKIDRRALPEPDSDSLVTSGFVAPQGEDETALAAIWSDLLKIERVGRHDNFFMLGGHSLLAVKMIEYLRQKGYTLSVRALFENPSLHALATCLRNDQAEAAIPPNIISPATEALTPDLLPLINLTQDDIDLIVHSVPGGVHNIQDIYALSPLQDGILFHHMMATAGDPYLVVLLRAFLDKASLDRYLAAFQTVVDRHDSFRTAIMWEHLSTPAQVVMRQASLSVTEHSLDPLNGPIVDQLEQIYNPQTYRIDLREAPLTRFAYAQDVDGRWVLIHLLHHLIGDHSTLDVLHEEMDAILDGRTEDLPAPQSIRNLIGQIRLGTSVEDHERYFHKMLQEIESHSLPYGLSDVHGDGSSAAEHHCMVPQDLNDKLRSHSKRLGASLASLCHLAWAQVIAATSAQSRVVFGTVLFGRMHGGADSDRAMGLFINTLPIRVDVEGASVQDSVRKVQADLAGLLEHQHASLAAVVSHPGCHFSALYSTTDGTPLFSAVLNYRHNTTPSQRNIMHVGEEIGLGHERTNYPVVMSVEDYGSSLGLTAQVVRPYESSRLCGYMQQALHSLAEALEQSPDTPVQTLNVLPAEEYELVVRTWNNTDAPYPSDRCVHQLFEDQAERRPDAAALLHGDRSMTYSMLSKCASYLACKLVALGVTPGDYVAILLDRSFELIISQLAVLKVEAAYVPIDTRAPVERQAYIMSDCGARILITDEHTDVPDVISASILRFRKDDASNMQDAFDGSRRPSLSSLDVAYVMYTSGSTGRPKGVMVPHRGIVRLAINNGFADIDSSDRVAFVANPTFDVSTFDVWVPLLNGASIVIIDRETLLDPPRLAADLDHHQVTSLCLTTALLHQYVHIIGAALSRLKYLMGAGEQGLVEAYTEMAKHGGRVCVINMYGPTEASVISTAYRITTTTSQLRRLPIGRPVSNTPHYVLDQHLVPVPIGVVGELYSGGPGVANGYLNQPELTAERFLPDPFAKVLGARMYRTGDLVRYLPDGNLVFVGRNDNQVKIRGFRVEPGEIEARLAEHPQVREALVLALGESSADKRLVAYVVAQANENLVQVLRECLSVDLPEYMVPSAFVRIDAFPLTNNGKIDRRALPEPDIESLVTCGYAAPQGEDEVALAAIWSDLLKVERVSRHDNFFMLGGHSLLAVKMIEHLRQKGHTLSVRSIFENPSLHALATCLRNDQAEAAIPPNIISPATEALTPDLLPLINLTQDDIDLIVHSVPGGVHNIQDIYALSPLQDGILFHHMMATAGDPYLVVLLRAFLDKASLDRYLAAFQTVVDRHDSFRTAIMWEHLSTPAQVVMRQASLSVTEHSLDPLNGPIVDQLEQIYNPQTYRIDLREAPLTRFAYAQDVDGRWVLIHLLHHLIGDHSTLDVLHEEMDAILDGRTEDLPAPQSIRNLIGQIRLGTSVEDHERYFHKMLQDIDSPSLPYGLSDVYVDAGSVAEYHCMLPQDLNNKLRSHAKRLGVSLASLCHLAWAQAIAATSGQSKVVFGTVLFGRMQAGAGSDRAMGLFMNMLPMRVDIECASAQDGVCKVQADLAGLLEHQHASLSVAQRCSGVPSGMPLFSAVLNYRHNITPSQRNIMHVGEEIGLGHERTNYPVVMSVEDYGSSLGLTAQVVRPYESSRLCGYMQQALHSLAEALGLSPDTPVQTLNVLPAEEYELVVRTWNNTDAPYPSDRCVHQLFEDQAERRPDAAALLHGDRSMTYSMLSKCASYLACKLVALGVTPGDYVAILLDRSFELIISQLAVLKVEAAYVPIDTRAPVERQGYIMSDCGARILITDEHTDVPDVISASILRFHKDDASNMQDAFDGSRRPSLSSLDVAYVMYTSGSTGRPKGVMVPHRGIVRLAINNGFADIDSSDRVAFGGNPAFDLSTFEIWVSLLNGACIVIIDQETLLSPLQLATVLGQFQITTLSLTTALLHQYVHIIGHALSNLRFLLAGGEQGLVDAFTELSKHEGRACVICMYGPTEASVTSTAYRITSTTGQLRRLPIGRPISNTPHYVLDSHQYPTPTGVVGELYIGGPGVANGYLNQPELTAERFLPDLFAKVLGARMYRTGDLVRYLPDGNLVFVGRNDNQVKIRGFRVEPGEIETRLTEHPQVREAVVLALGESSDDKRLVAYTVAEPHRNIVQILREYLSVRLPEYMLPSAYVRMDSFPLTNNGKIDRRALPEPKSDSVVTCGYAPPQGEDEIALAAIWLDLLKVERVGRHDNFFMLGGHSFLAIRMINIVRSSLGVDLKLRLVLSTPTVAELAMNFVHGYVKNNQDDEYGVLIPIKTQGCRAPLFCVHSGLGLSWSYRGLVKHLHPEQPLYGLQARGLDGESPMATSIEEMTLDYIDHIRTIQPQGPYHLLGWSFGGKVAHSIAVEFQHQGDSVSLLAIIDAAPDFFRIGEAESSDQNTSKEVDELLDAVVRDIPVDDTSAFKANVKPIVFNNTRLARSFAPSVYNGDLLFFRATIPYHEGKTLLDPACWRPYIRGDVEVHDVQCKHEDLKTSKNLAVVGRIVAAWTEKL
ncbi:unnamed protein product [Mortierella alpina]